MQKRKENMKLNDYIERRNRDAIPGILPMFVSDHYWEPRGCWAGHGASATEHPGRAGGNHFHPSWGQPSSAHTLF